MKFKKFLSTALAAVMATSVLSIGMVSSAYALKATVDCLDTSVGFTAKNTPFNPNQNENITISANAQDAGKGLKFNKASASPITGLSSSSNYVKISADPGDTISLDIYDGTEWEIYKGEQTLSLYDTQPSASAGTIKFKQIEEKDTYVIVCSSNSSANGHIKTINVEPGAVAEKYSLSGSINYTGCNVNDVNILIGGEQLTVEGEGTSGTYEIQLAANTYDVTVDQPMLYTIDPAQVVVPEGGTTKDFTVTKKPTTELTITPDSKLGLSGDTIDVKDDKGNVVQATKSNTDYKATVAQNGTYTIDVLGDAGYKASEYAVTGYEVTVGSDASKTFPLGAEEITVWDFVKDAGKTLPANASDVIQEGTGKYKGLTIDATASYQVGSDTRHGKFNPSTSASGGAQVNSKTKITVPLGDAATKTLKVTVAEKDKANAVPIGYSISVEGNDAILTIGDPASDNNYTSYVAKLEIADKNVANSVQDVSHVGTDRTFDVYAPSKDSTGTYIIHPIVESDLKNGDTLTLATTGGDKVETKTVYKSVKFDDDSTLNASDIGADYIFAVLVSDAAGAGPANALTWTIANAGA